MAVTIKNATIKSCNLFQNSGLIGWYDASDDATITTATGVSQWNDKSGLGRNLVQATGSKQPTRTNTQNGLKVLTFASASSQTMGTSSNFTINKEYFTLFAVAKRATNNAYHCLFSCLYNSTTGIAFDFAGGTSQDWLANDIYFIGNGFSPTQTPRIIGSGSATTDNVFHQYDGCIGFNNQSLNADGSSLSIRISSAANITPVTGTFSIGSVQIYNDWFNGDIAEILIYSTSAPLSATQTANIRSYLKTKWATP